MDDPDKPPENSANLHATATPGAESFTFCWAFFLVSPAIVYDGARLTARVAADEAGPWEARPWSFGERQALSLVVAGLPQPYLNEVFSVIGLGQTFPDGSFRVVDLPRGGFASLPVSICDRAHQYVADLAKAR